MIRLNCFFQATDGDQYKDALRAAVALTEKSRNHAGCILMMYSRARPALTCL